MHLKDVKFTGCDGNIVFDKQTNLRKLSGHNILQFRFDENIQDFRINLTGQYNALGCTLFMIPDVEWRDNEVPSDTRPLYKNCAFEKYQISENENGHHIMYISGIMISLYA